MTLRCVLPGIATGSRHTFLMFHQADGEPRCLVDIITNDFELRSHLQLDNLIAFSLPSDKAVLLKGEAQ